MLPLRKNIILAFVFFLFMSAPIRSEAGSQHGYQIIENPQGIQMHVLHLKAGSKRQCKIVMQTYYKGMLLDCPKCKVITSGCSGTLVEVTKKMVSKEKAFFPYMIWGSHDQGRQWIVGIDRKRSRDFCKEFAQKYRKNGIPATCVEKETLFFRSSVCRNFYDSFGSGTDISRLGFYARFREKSGHSFVAALSAL